MSKAILIDTEARAVHMVDVIGATDIHSLLHGYFEVAFMWPNGDVLYVDEDGFRQRPLRVFHIYERPDQPLAGNGVIVGEEQEPEDDDSYVVLDDVKQTVAEVARKVRFTADV
jgi:hypothetical protein